MAQVISLFTCPAIGRPMQDHTFVRALAGFGLEGDRYALGQGSHSHRLPLVPRHISIIASEAIEAANAELVQRGLLPFTPRENRRNIVVEGVDVYELVGQKFRIGAVWLRGSEPTRPCHIPSAVAGKSHFRETYQDRGGIRAEVLSDGIIVVGDTVATGLPLVDC
ncbi:MAG TPA: MOSC domain-containing protein [Xanthobacteraceae bacterium]|nr:MOSC domain-containing protein [Xanthobacteraceae bacterium]